ncbi:hypothetical protein FXN63_00100 [Pigmentiphaga aceris]|uniref:Uncharacterized protein n=1 Tax=Pigmentiphaga aceris TaxID=1940612 RepID=A0A5C0AS66_9BURK|nr:DUF5713 family protein [Pigmentiphaga aceris]QEI04414.1 hypothetical protein FXN63_00100 [Pigmentiphaga aceris]
MPITNPAILEHRFLAEMLDSSYYPTAVVQQGVEILQDLSAQIEATQPRNLDALYALTNAATERFNELVDAFYDAGSEIDTVARDCIAVDVLFIAQTYGFADADIEELTATRDW